MAPNFSETVWLVLLLIGGCGLLAMLHGMAVIARAHMQAHDMRLKVTKLRRRYAAELSGEQSEFGDVEIIECDPAAPGAARQAA